MFRTAVLLFIFLTISTYPQQLKAFEVNDRWGYKDENGKTVLLPIYLFALDFNKAGTTAVFTDSGWVYIDKKGAVLFSVLAFDNGADYLSCGLSRFTENGKIGYFNESGRIVISPLFDFAFPFKNGSALVCSECLTVKNGEHYLVSGGN